MEKAVNPDLWERLLALCETHKVRFEWVRGHTGHPENELCDKLATSAAESPNLAIDEAYKRQ
jgi:ribonuclease HI